MNSPFTWGSYLTLTIPTNNTNAVNYFGLDWAINTPEQEVISWKHPGSDGLQKKLMGVGGASGMISGFLDSSTQAGIGAAMASIQTYVSAGYRATATFANNFAVSDVALTKITWGQYGANAAGRYTQYFTIFWEAP